MFRLDKALSPLTSDDYEEARLLREMYELQELGRKAFMQAMPKERAKMREDGLSETQRKKFTELQSVLGYVPEVGRKARPRGRPRDSSIPDPVPAVGTELQSCLGEVYTVAGYAHTAVHGHLAYPNVILYRHNDDIVARPVANLFAGMLGDQPIVTWPDDPRGLKPGAPVPLSLRRSMTKQDLKADREARDEDLRQYNLTKHKRY